MASFLLLSVIDSSGWLCMGSVLKNSQFMLEFLKAPFFTLITFLMISVILLSVLMILVSTQDQASGQWQQLELACKLESGP